MASSNVSSVVKYFSTANEGFVTTLNGSISSGASIVPLNSVSGLTDGTVFVGIIEPGSANQQTFTGDVDVAGLRITGVIWTRGTNVAHSSGVSIVDYVSGTGHNMATVGMLKEHNQNGTHSNITATSITATTGTFTNVVVNGTANTAGWSPIGGTASTVTYNGNRSYSVVFNGVDLTSTVSNGTPLRVIRTVSAPTQCTSLNGTTQYFVKTSPNKLTFTDDFVVSAWVKIPSYQAGYIISRYNGTSGWGLRLEASGQLTMVGFNAGAGNFSQIGSFQSIPLNKWVHLTAQLDMSSFTNTATTSYMMVDGLDVPLAVSRAGTNPTALIQAGNLEIGTANAGTFFNGKIAQVAVFNAKVTQATMRTYISQGLAGTETSLACAYSFNNSVNDLNTTTPNNLSVGGGSATATNADSPFAQDDAAVPTATTDVAIVTGKVFSTNTTLTVQVPEGCTIPTTGGVSSVSYATATSPFGFVRNKSRWILEVYNYNQFTLPIGSINTWVGAPVYLPVPVGSWNIGYMQNIDFISSASGTRNGAVGLGDSTIIPLVNGQSNHPLVTSTAGSGTDGIFSSYADTDLVLTSQTTFVFSGQIYSATGSETYAISPNSKPIRLFARNNYI